VRNDDVAAVFLQAAALIELSGGDPFRARAFRRTAKIIADLAQPVADLLPFGRLQQVRGIGGGSVERVKSILRTGSFTERDRLAAQFPPGMLDLIQLRGVGAKTVRMLRQTLGIESVDQLRAAVDSGAIQRVRGVGPKTIAVLIDALAHRDKKTHRVSLKEALAIGAELVAFCRGLDDVVQVAQCGSARRRKRTVGDLDILIGTSDGKRVVSQFCTFPRIRQVMLAGPSRASVRLDTGIQVDVRVVAPETFGAGLHYFTGSQNHNIAVRLAANQRGLAINEHGVFTKAEGRRGSSDVRVGWARREEEVFAAVGLPFIAPELRENGDEMAAARQKKLPVLVDDGALPFVIVDERTTTPSSFRHVPQLQLGVDVDIVDTIDHDGERPWVWHMPTHEDRTREHDVVDDEPPKRSRLDDAAERGAIGVLWAGPRSRTSFNAWRDTLRKTSLALVLPGVVDDWPDERDLKRAVQERLPLAIHSGRMDDDGVEELRMCVYALRRAWCTREHLLPLFVEVGGSDVGDDSLLAMPLSDDARERLQAYLQGAVDPTLERQLQQQAGPGEHALQRAFTLLHQP